MATAPERPIFLKHLARRALDQRPPIGFVRGITVEQRGEHPGKVDIKHGGIMIIGNLARAHAIRAGITAKRTIDRLRASEQAGAIDAETREGLEEAFRFLWEIRLHHHVEQLALGGPAGRLRRSQGARRRRASGSEGGVPHHRPRPEGARAGGRHRVPLAGLTRVARGSGRR